MSPKRAHLSLDLQVKSYSLQKGNDPRNLILNKNYPKPNDVIPLFERPNKSSIQKDINSELSKAVAKNLKSIKI